MLSLGELPPLLKRARVIVDGDVRETVRDIRPSTSVMACTGAAMHLSRRGTPTGSSRFTRLT